MSHLKVFFAFGNPGLSQSIYYLNHTGIFVTVPTSVPTTPDSNLVDECDDDQANCHSGTGDDFQLTGAETILVPFQHHFCLVQSPVAMFAFVKHVKIMTHACNFCWAS